jgi:hypothetical protein
MYQKCLPLWVRCEHVRNRTKHLLINAQVVCQKTEKRAPN